jgi:hypothetical protein
MAINYSWIIPQLECYPEHEGKKDVVFMVHWRRQALVDGLMADVYGSQAVTLDAAAPFTPFEKLTKKQVEGWLEALMGSEHIANLDANLAKQIAASSIPPLMPLPWGA